MSGQPEVTSRDRRELSESLVKYRGFPCSLGCLPGGLLSGFHAHGRPDRRGVLSGLRPLHPVCCSSLWRVSGLFCCNMASVDALKAKAQSMSIDRTSTRSAPRFSLALERRNSL